MAAKTKESEVGTPSTGKWLLMFYVAADNNLSALFVDQLKAIKDAGFAQDVDVIVRFDPNEPDLKTLTFNVNKKRKKSGRPIQVGDGEDSFVRDMIEDLIESEPDDLGAADSLDRFIDYCFRKYKEAHDNHNPDHYMLFLLGHGLIVGNDSFLPDDFPRSGITLKQLGRILRTNFGENQQRSLELLGLQACAMSGIEVLYELQGTAKYMIGSEGLSFVNGWPYRQLMKRFLHGLCEGESIEHIIESIYWLTYFNAKDFLLAGFPLELSLLSLAPSKVDRLTSEMQRLVRLLILSLDSPHGCAAIQLAHLRSQSYFGELYTDLRDFCQCLKDQCKTYNLPDLGIACQRVIKELKLHHGDLLKRFEGLIIHSNHFGWKSQYSHGLSIMFPWVEPRKNAKPEEQVMAMYEDYRFTRDLGMRDSWLSFLLKYFEKTMRCPPRTRQDFSGALQDFKLSPPDERQWTAALELPEKPTGASEKPTGGSDSSTCDCPEIKNFPRKYVDCSRPPHDKQDDGDLVIL
jgi:hypothetical protein